MRLDRNRRTLVAMTHPRHDISDHLIRTQADLEAVWRHLMEPLGFSDGSTWAMAIGPDDRPTRHLIEIQDGGSPPAPEHVANFGEALCRVGQDVEPGTRWAFLRVRPGRGGARAADRTLVAALLASCRAAGVPTEVAHFANDDLLMPLPYDELAASAS